MRLHRPNQRAGFTILELLLASMIAAILLGALYLALNTTLEQTQASRDAADVEDLSRGAFNRISIDLSSVLGPLPAKIAGTSGGGGMSMDMTGMTGMDDGSGGETMADPNATAAANLPFHAGIIGVTDGERKYLVIFASRVPNVLSTPGALVQGTESSQNPSDLRRIVYWKGANGGLCREERLWITADGVGNSTTPDLSNEAGNTIVDDVVDFNVQYADGSGGWLDDWDGTTSSATGSGMSGPPRAVKVTLTLEFPNPRPGGEPIQKTYVQVIPIRTAPGATAPTLVDPVVPTDTTATDMGMGMGGK
jgi:prepilin-type N-terminal cleavage/methylation domain-containing protein